MVKQVVVMCKCVSVTDVAPKPRRHGNRTASSNPQAYQVGAGCALGAQNMLPKRVCAGRAKSPGLAYKTTMKKNVASLAKEAAREVILGTPGFETDYKAAQKTDGLDQAAQVRYWRTKMEGSGAADVLREAHLAEQFIDSAQKKATAEVRGPGRKLNSKNKPKPGPAHLHGATTWDAYKGAHKEAPAAVAAKKMTAAEASRMLAARGITLGAKAIANQAKTAPGHSPAIFVQTNQIKLILNIVHDEQCCLCEPCEHVKCLFPVKPALVVVL
jgi:hypothetical protein